MNFGFSAPTRGPQATPDALAKLVKRGEELGFGIVSVSDHVVIPRTANSTYPYSEDGSFRGGAECMEQLTLHAYLAAVTKRLRLLTAVMVVPHRPPVLTAKVLATVDVLSGGRLIVGCGAGWLREEFEAIGAPDFDRRGAVTNEYLRAFKELWTSDEPTFEGEFCSFSNLHFEPKPVQKPHPPIWTGGESPAALRRASRLADKWFPIGTNPTYPVRTPEQLAESLSQVRRHAEDAGRDPTSVGVAYSAGMPAIDEPLQHSDGSRRAFTGAPEQIANDIQGFQAEGVEDMTFRFERGTLDETLEAMQKFAEEVMAKL